ncbi:MAG: ferritin [Planctomycetota bacterium]|nr:ferritin [Planctomycetota bacterium]
MAKGNRLSPEIEEMLVDQINMELYSGYIYLSMATWCEDQDLGGFAHWLELQANEELEHAMKIYAHVHERRGRVILDAIGKPKTEWDSALEVFEEAFEHECKVSDSINKIVSAAKEEGDHATDSFLQWFVDEQVEEEESADAIVQKLKMVSKSHHGLYMLDRELGSRTAD